MSAAPTVQADSDAGDALQQETDGQPTEERAGDDDGAPGPSPADDQLEEPATSKPRRLSTLRKNKRSSTCPGSVQRSASARPASIRERKRASLYSNLDVASLPGDLGQDFDDFVVPKTESDLVNDALKELEHERKRHVTEINTDAKESLIRILHAKEVAKKQREFDEAVARKEMELRKVRADLGRRLSGQQRNLEWQRSIYGVDNSLSTELQRLGVALGEDDMVSIAPSARNVRRRSRSATPSRSRASRASYDTAATEIIEEEDEDMDGYRPRRAVPKRRATQSSMPTQTQTKRQKQKQRMEEEDAISDEEEDEEEDYEEWGEPRRSRPRRKASSFVEDEDDDIEEIERDISRESMILGAQLRRRLSLALTGERSSQLTAEIMAN